MENKPNKLTRAHKIALSIISLACCCVIGVSAFALVAPDAVEQLTGQQTEAVDNQEGSEQSDSETADSQETDGDSANSEASSQGERAQNENGSSSSSENSSNNSKGASSSGNGSSNGSSASSGSGNSNNSKSSNGSSNKSTSGGSSQGSQGAATGSDTVTVSVSVSSSAADGRVSGSAHPTFKKGATAYDALCATGLSISTKNSQYGIYVSAIGGLAEFEYGGKSGWMYSVNGNTPNVSCSSYKLKDGDSVSWYYVK